MVYKSRDGRQHTNRRLDALLAGQPDPGPLPEARPVRKEAAPAQTSEGCLEVLETVDKALIKSGMDEVFREFMARVILLKHIDLSEG
jgi:hypothetical protein